MLCQPSPKVSTAATQLFVLPSLASYRREPKVWHTEFTANLACSRAKIRISPAHTITSGPRLTLPVATRPMARGRPTESATQTRWSRSTTWIHRSS